MENSLIFKLLKQRCSKYKKAISFFKLKHKDYWYGNITNAVNSRKTCTFLTMQEAVTQDKDLLKIITTKGNSTASCNQYNRTQSLTVAADTEGKQVS